MEPLVRNISDTARWVANYRARENERPDALFRDPYAARLAGKRGQEIANVLSAGERNAWAFVTRTYLFDTFLKQQLDAGADTVINLAAGLDARPYRMELPASLRWFEIDPTWQVIRLFAWMGIVELRPVHEQVETDETAPAKAA